MSTRTDTAEITVTAGPIPEGREPRWLVAPIAPDTALQSVLGMDVPEGEAIEIQATNGTQRALAFRWRPDLEPVFTYRFAEIAPAPAPADHFARIDGPLTTPTDELAAYVREMIASETQAHRAIAEIADYVASVFEYDHPKNRFTDGKTAVPLLLAPTRGSCMDIHGFFLSCLYAAGLEGCYYAGYFFKGDAIEAQGMHCWLTAREGERLQDWDIAHQLIGRPGCHVEPGFAGVPGRRFATSHGRGLRFRIDDIGFSVGHLAYPVWVLGEGEATGLGVQAVLSTRADPTTDAAERPRAHEPA